MLTKSQAQALAACIQREMTGVATTIRQDEYLALEESYHVDVYQPNVVRLCMRSEAQWEGRKHLIRKWGSHEGELAENHDDQARDDQSVEEK